MAFARGWISVFVVLAGCGPDLPPESPGPDGTSTSTSTTAPAPGSSSDPSATGATGLDESTSTTDAEGSSSTTTGEPEECVANPKLGCNPLTPSPCSGERECTYDYHPKGGGWVCGCSSGNAGPYEPCMLDYAPSDSCAPEQICSFGDEFGPSRCHPLCGSSLCSETSVCLGDSCFEPCDPLAPYACPRGIACVRVQDRFACTDNLSPRPVGVGEPCEQDGGCEHGLVCRPADQVTGCDADECCAAVCDTTAPEPCAPGEACVPLFREPQPGSETLGACTPA